jgi:hypothetical protein
MAQALSSNVFAQTLIFSQFHAQGSRYRIWRLGCISQYSLATAAILMQGLAAKVVCSR